MALLRKPDERRSEPRRPANVRGVIVGPSLEMACLIVDVVAGTACEAEVAWRKGHEAGLKCRVRATPLQGLVPARFAQARDAWLRAGGRPS